MFSTVCPLHKMRRFVRHTVGKYPVLFLSLKGVDGLTFEDAYDRLRCLIRNEAFRLDFLRESSAITAEEKNSYLRILSETDRFSDITESLKMLSILLESLSAWLL